MSTLCRDRKSSTDVYNSQGSLLWSWPHLAFNCSLTSSWPLPVLFLLSSTMDVVLESLSRVWLLVLSQTAAHQASLSFTISWSLLRLKSIESVVPSNHLIFCCFLLLLPSIFPSTRVFSNESALYIKWSKDWSFSFSISLSNENLGLLFFMIDWFDLFVVQGTLKSLLQHRSWKASILWCSAFCMVQLSHQHMTTGKTIALSRGTFVSKVTSLLFNMLSMLVIAFFFQGASIV